MQRAGETATINATVKKGSTEVTDLSSLKWEISLQTGEATLTAKTGPTTTIKATKAGIVTITATFSNKTETITITIGSKNTENEKPTPTVVISTASAATATSLPEAKNWETASQNAITITTGSAANTYHLIKIGTKPESAKIKSVTFDPNSDFSIMDASQHVYYISTDKTGDGHKCTVTVTLDDSNSTKITQDFTLNIKTHTNSSGG